jgi:hypothetical protein
VVDIMEALKASLNQLKKPAASETQATRPVVVEMPAVAEAAEPAKKKRAARRAGAAG